MLNTLPYSMRSEDGIIDWSAHKRKPTRWTLGAAISAALLLLSLCSVVITLYGQGYDPYQLAQVIAIETSILALIVFAADRFLLWCLSWKVTMWIEVILFLLLLSYIAYGIHKGFLFPHWGS